MGFMVAIGGSFINGVLQFGQILFMVLYIIGGNGPLIAAIYTKKVYADKEEYKDFIKQIFRFKISVLWYLGIGQSMIVEGSLMEPSLHDEERLFVNKFIYDFKSPERYDVIVFRPEHNPKVRFIKRVIGLPGETIIIRDGKTYIDGKPLEENYVKESMINNYGSFKVPKNHVFVMGDNRNNSLDSWYSYVGYINYKNIVGEAFWIYWPLKNIKIVSSLRVD